MSGDANNNINGVPCAIMRGGTSKGVYFLLQDLPAEEAERNALILRLVGGDARQINGLGGGDMLTAKVAIVSPAEEAGADLDYRFAQVVPGEARVDTGPTCGNILAGVGAFAMERGLVAARGKTTTLTIRDINTGARVEQTIQTPNGRVCYEGDCRIAGVEAAGAPVLLYYLDFAGVATGKLFPTGNKQDIIDGVKVSCVDAAMPTVFADAQDMGATGAETREELQNNANLLRRLEALRLQAARAMGMGDARGKVTPKFALAARPRDGGAICARYFTPVSAHAAFAVSGGIALATALMTKGTMPAALANAPTKADADGAFACDIEHPSGKMQVRVVLGKNGEPRKAGIARTTRLIMSGVAPLAGA